MPNLTNKRTLQDVNALITQALPAAGATVNSPSLDLGSTTAFRIPGIELLLSVPAAPALANGKKITFTVQHSRSNVGNSFVPVPGLAPFVITGVDGAGSAATPTGQAPFQFKLPLGLNRFLRVVAVADADAGNSTAVSFTFGPVF